MSPLEMGKGFTLSTGAIVSEHLNLHIKNAALKHDIPMQLDVCGADTGTDGMAGVLASIDCAATSIGFPIRNMHTISESGNTSDVLAAIHVIFETIRSMEKIKGLHNKFKTSHPRLDKSIPLKHKKAKASRARSKK